MLLNKFSSSANAVFAITIAMRKNFSDLIVDVLVILANAKPFDEQNVKGNTTSALKSFLFKTRRRIARSKWCNAHHKIVQNRSVCSISSALNAFFRECSLQTSLKGSEERAHVMKLSRHLEGKSSEFYTQTLIHINCARISKIPHIKRFREDA